MAHEVFDFVIPLFRMRWNTRAVLEGLTKHYQPRSIHVIAPEPEARSLADASKDWDTASLKTYAEEAFFHLTKDEICAELDLGKSLYTPGWFYQQLLKLGASEGIAGLSEWYAVWDSDLLPVDTWPLMVEENDVVKHKFALIQHNQYGNAKIVSAWATWIQSILGVEPVVDETGTFIPHHMWFKQEYLESFKRQINKYFQSDDHWLQLMMRSANEFDTFGEYWCYSSWVAAKAPNDLAFYPYEQYGETTERFFDDGTGLFSAALRQYLQEQTGTSLSADEPFSPSYEVVDAFIQQTYGLDSLPSSLSFESSPRHLKKDEKNMHIEERRSRWNPRMVEPATS